MSPVDPKNIPATRGVSEDLSPALVEIANVATKGKKKAKSIKGDSSRAWWSGGSGGATDANDAEIPDIALDDLTDVVITTPADNEVLAFDDGDDTWKNQPLSSIHEHTRIQDLDADTKIQCEESADEDKIRFDVAGNEKEVVDTTTHEFALNLMPEADGTRDFGSSLGGSEKRWKSVVSKYLEATSATVTDVLILLKRVFTNPTGTLVTEPVEIQESMAFDSGADTSTVTDNAHLQRNHYALALNKASKSVIVAKALQLLSLALEQVAGTLTATNTLFVHYIRTVVGSVTNNGSALINGAAIDIYKKFLTGHTQDRWNGVATITPAASGTQDSVAVVFYERTPDTNYVVQLAGYCDSSITETSPPGVRTFTVRGHPTIRAGSKAATGFTIDIEWQVFETTGGAIVQVGAWANYNDMIAAPQSMDTATIHADVKNVDWLVRGNFG